MKSGHTGLLCESISSSFHRHFEVLSFFAKKTEMEWQIIVRLMVVFQLRKKVTASGKLSRANCDGKMNTLPQIQGVSNCRATREQRTWNLIFDGEFPHIFKRNRGDDCSITRRGLHLMDVVCFTDFHHHHLCHTTLGLFLSSLLYFVFIKFVCSVYFKKKF